MGLVCDTQSSSELLNLAFLLGRKGKAEISGELYFPPIFVYPTFPQFTQLTLQDGFSKLSSMNFKQHKDIYGLSGIQLVFSNGFSTPLFQTPQGKGEQLNTIAIIIKERDFYRWLACFTNPYADGEDCGDYNGLFYACYMYNSCAGVVDEFWHDCYWWGEGCDQEAKTDIAIVEEVVPEPIEPTVEEVEQPVEVPVTNTTAEAETNATISEPEPAPIQRETYDEFFSWLTCYTGVDAFLCEDPEELYFQCYMNRNCDGIVDEYWFACYWRSQDCDLWEAQNQNSIDFY